MRRVPLNRAQGPRRHRRLASPTQRRRIDELSKQLDTKVRLIFWEHDAVKEIKRLEQMQRQPVLEGFSL